MPASSWLPDLSQASGPLYLALAQVIAADIASGRLQNGTALPTQRALAQSLGIDFTTVGRAYAQVKAKGLIASAPGKGTFVRAPRPHANTQRENDLSMNMPPAFDDAALSARMWQEIGGLSAGGAAFLLRYQRPEADPQDLAAGQAWLKPLWPDADPRQIALAPGAQGAVHSILRLLTAPDDWVAAEALTYPGFKATASWLGLKIAPIAMDAGGMIPEAAEEVFARHRPKLLYTTPTLHNPTTRTLSPARRQAIAGLAVKYGVKIVEDDAYALLPATPIAPLGSYAPQLSYCVATLSKALAPALKLAYVLCPDGQARDALLGAMRGTANLPAPLATAVASEWIHSGLAQDVCAAIRHETAIRHKLALRLLGSGVESDPAAYHLYLPLPATRALQFEQLAAIRGSGVGAIPAEVFALGQTSPALRLSLGSAPDRATLEDSLRKLTGLLAQDPARNNFAV